MMYVADGTFSCGARTAASIGPTAIPGWSQIDRLLLRMSLFVACQQATWIGNFWDRGVVLMAGDNTKGHPAGTETGDAIHVFKGGSIQMLTDVSIDPAGNVWAANNWNDLNGAAAPDPLRPTSTWGGGFGHHRHLRSGGAGEAAAHGQGPKVPNELS